MEWGEFRGVPVLAFWKPHPNADYAAGQRHAVELVAFARAQHRPNLVAIVTEAIFDGKYLGGRPIGEAERGFLNKISLITCAGALN